MRAVVFEEFGGPQVVRLGERPDPVPGPGEVLIEVRAASVNPVDVKRIGGMGRVDLPAGTGFDAAGVVLALGPGVEIGEDREDLAVGDEVFGLGNPTHAERAVLGTAVRKPAGWSWAEAAGAGLAGETADRGLRLLGVDARTTVLVDGASGGVGSFAVQLAVARGATVIATASEANHDYLRTLGATPVRYGDGLADRVASALRELGRDRLDAVFDVVGRTSIEVLTGLVPSADRVLSIANFDAGRHGARVSGGGADSTPAASLRTVAALADRLLVRIEAEYPLDETAEAFTTIAGGHVRGKLVLVP